MTHILQTIQLCSTRGNVATATALQTARNFEITGAVTAGALGPFDGPGNVTLTTQFANQTRPFNNDAGFVTSGLTTDTIIAHYLSMQVI